MSEELGEAAKVDEEQRARGSTTTDKGSQGTQRNLVFIQRTMGHHWRASAGECKGVLQRWLWVLSGERTQEGQVRVGGQLGCCCRCPGERQRQMDQSGSSEGGQKKRDSRVTGHKATKM